MMYLPDRFYLNTSPYLEHDQHGGQQHQRDECAKTFSRARYLEQVHEMEENIQCVILSTYRLDWVYMQEEFSLLFDKNLAIPSLILHGEKRDDEKQWWSKYDKSEDSNNIDIEETQQQVEDNEISVMQQDDEVERRQNVQSIPDDGITMGGNVNMQVREVIPQWALPMGDDEVTVTKLKLLDSHSRFMAGVHHPKYMLIFTDRGIHVCISTANLTKNGSVDASWIQFFPRVDDYISNTVHHETIKHEVNDNSSSTVEFGVILEDFICKVSSTYTVTCPLSIL